MTYDQLLTLENIVKYGSFKAASEIMFKSQPSLSMAIKKLEEEFGFLIFNRDGYRPVLTEEGLCFYNKSKAMLESFKSLEHLGKELGAGIETEINFCTDAIFPISEFSETLSQFFLPHISTQLNLSSDVLDGVIHKILSHEVDMAIGPKLKQYDEAEIEMVHMFNVEVIPVIGSKHYNPDTLCLESLKKIPHIIVRSSLNDKNVKDKISDQFWFTSDFSIKKQMIESGLGWGRLPTHIAKESLNLGNLFEIKHIPSVLPVRAPMYLQRSKTKVLGENSKRLWDFLIKKNKPGI